MLGGFFCLFGIFSSSRNSGNMGHNKHDNDMIPKNCHSRTGFYAKL